MHTLAQVTRSSNRAETVRLHRGGGYGGETHNSAAAESIFSLYLLPRHPFHYRRATGRATRSRAAHSPTPRQTCRIPLRRGPPEKSAAAGLYIVTARPNRRTKSNAVGSQYASALGKSKKTIPSGPALASAFALFFFAPPHRTSVTQTRIIFCGPLRVFPLPSPPPMPNIIPPSLCNSLFEYYSHNIKQYIYIYTYIYVYI